MLEAGMASQGIFFLFCRDIWFACANQGCADRASFAPSFAAVVQGCIGLCAHAPFGFVSVAC